MCLPPAPPPAAAVSSLSVSRAIVGVRTSGLPSRISRMVTPLPTGVAATSRDRSVVRLIFWPSNSTMISPDFTPIRAAGEPSKTLETSAPS